LIGLPAEHGPDDRSEGGARLQGQAPSGYVKMPLADAEDFLWKATRSETEDEQHGLA